MKHVSKPQAQLKRCALKEFSKSFLGSLISPCLTQSVQIEIPCFNLLLTQTNPIISEINRNKKQTSLKRSDLLISSLASEAWLDWASFDWRPAMTAPLRGRATRRAVAAEVRRSRGGSATSVHEMGSKNMEQRKEIGSPRLTLSV